VLGAVFGQPVELGQRDAVFTVGADEDDRRVQSGHRDRHVGRVHGDAVFGRAEDGVVADVAVDGRAAGAGAALVARCGDVLKVDAAGALQQVARRRREVAQLTRRGRQQRTGQHGVAAADDGVSGEVAVADVGSHAKAAVGQLLHVGERQMADVDDKCGRHDAELHVVDEVGAACEEHRVGAVSHGGDGVGDTRCAVIVEGDHCADSRIAARMFG
jgi:hypothetical protein